MISKEQFRDIILKQVKLDNYVEEMRKLLKWDEIYENDYIQSQALQFEAFLACVCTEDGTNVVLYHMYERDLDETPITAGEVDELYDYLEENEMLCK